MFNWYFPIGLGILFLVVWVFRAKANKSKPEQPKEQR